MCTERLRIVKAHIDASHEIRCEAHKPGILTFAGGSGFTGERNAEFFQRMAGAALYNAFKHGDHLISCTWIFNLLTRIGNIWWLNIWCPAEILTAGAFAPI